MHTFQPRAYAAAIDLSEGERAVVATITTDAVDSYREAILPKGIDLSAYRKNPVVLWCHDLSAPPIGRSLWVKANDEKRGLIAKVKFAETEAGEEVWQLYKQDILRAFSIGAPIGSAEGSAPTSAELRARPEMAGCKWVWRKLVMSELSAVPVGANPEALTIAVSKGLALSDSIRKQLAPIELPPPAREPEPLPDLPPLVGRSFKQAHAELLRSIRRDSPAEIARRLMVDEVDRIKGRV